MEYKLVIHKNIENKLDSIFDYIYSETLNINIAKRVYEKIYSAIN
jgi:hypothetical protein